MASLIVVIVVSLRDLDNSVLNLGFKSSNCPIVMLATVSPTSCTMSYRF